MRAHGFLLDNACMRSIVLSPWARCGRRGRDNAAALYNAAMSPSSATVGALWAVFFSHVKKRVKRNNGAKFASLSAYLVVSIFTDNNFARPLFITFTGGETISSRRRRRYRFPLPPAVQPPAAFIQFGIKPGVIGFHISDALRLPATVTAGIFQQAFQFIKARLFHRHHHRRRGKDIGLCSRFHNKIFSGGDG